MPEPFALGAISGGIILFVYLIELISSIISAGPYGSSTQNFLLSLGLPVFLLSTLGNSLVTFAVAKCRYGNAKGIWSYGAGTVAGSAAVAVIVAIAFIALVIIATLFSVAASGGQ